MCKCSNVEFGTYSNQTEVDRPKHMLIRGGKSTIGIDACIVEEIQYLWSKGISTTGCCCGHNRLPGFVGVIDEDIDKMINLGYSVQTNKCRPNDRDTFNLKTI